MSKGRFTKSAINWKEFAKLVSDEEKPKFMGFKAKADAYMQRVLANPSSPPPIKWEEYQKSVPVKGLVDKFKTSYESFKVPYPQDTLSAKVDEQWQSLQPQIKAFCDERQKEIQAAQKELDRINSLPSFDVITLEMFKDLYPDQALDPVNNPTFWPHTPDEQMGYVDPHAQKGDH